MHLWEFLFELLHDEECRPFISWTKKGRKEFKITQPECVAQLWGLEHNRKNMTYDKLSRALRQYYKEGIVRKVAINEPGNYFKVAQNNFQQLDFDGS